jgi:hypothetical protein
MPNDKFISGLDRQAAIATASGYVPTISQYTTIGVYTTQINAATVAPTASSVPCATATDGKRFARCIVNCDKSHTIKFYGNSTSFSESVTGAYLLSDYTKTGVAAVSGYLGNSYLIDCSAHAYIAIVVYNDDASNNATVTSSISFCD